MDIVKYTAQLDLTDNGCFDAGWRIKQGDYGNSQLMISLVDNGVNAFDANVTPQINFKRPDGKSVLANMTVEQNVYSYIFAGNELEIAGTVLMDVKFITPQGRTSSASCKFTCVEDTIGIDPTGASTYYNPVAEVIEEAKALAEEVGGFTGAIEDLRQNKQNKLIAGRNITIDEETNIISASGGGGGGASAAVDVSYDNTTTQMSANNVQDAIDSVFISVSNGKELVASAITDKGIPTLATDTFAIMAEHIAEIEGGASGGGQTYFKFYDPVGGTKVDTFTSTMNGTLKLVAVGYMNAFATIKINGNVIPATESYYITSHYYYYVYVETQVNKNDIIEVSGTATGTSSFSILASIVGDGMDIADTTANESDVKLGKVFHLADGSSAVGTNTDVDVSDTTATQNDVLSGKYFYDNKGIKRNGNIPVENSPHFEINSLDIRMLPFYERYVKSLSFSLASSEIDKMIPENIKKDVEILGVTGTFEGEGGTDVSDTTAIESDVAAGKVFHLADGSRAVGTYETPKLASGQIRLSTSASTNIDCGFRPKVVNILMGSSYTAVGGVQLDYVESISTAQQWVSGNSNALPTTTNNRIGSINENGFTLTKVSDTRYSYCTYYAIG